MKRWGKPESRNKHKGGTSLFTVKLCRLLCVTLRPNASACLGVIAVTFGTLGKLFDRRGLYGNLRFEVSRSTTVIVLLFAKAQTSHYLVIALNVCTLQIIQQTTTLRDHLEQAAPGVVILFMDFEMLGKLVDSLAQ